MKRGLIQRGADRWHSEGARCVPSINVMDSPVTWLGRSVIYRRTTADSLTAMMLNTAVYCILIQVLIEPFNDPMEQISLIFLLPAHKVMVFADVLNIDCLSPKTTEADEYFVS